ncbi:MAG: malonyl-CoA decarboxylase [Hydrogenophaga sp.]|jgi:malonyl-CoA decarboxylase|nr:malonyl-CoA decarboxylase [Hydrogenophaga sp.]
MNTPEWITRGVSMLRSAPRKGPDESAAGRAGRAKPPARSTQERLKATLRREEEALSPRVLRRLLGELQSIVDARVSEVEGGRRAQDVASWYAGAAPEERHDMWLLMSEQFVADPTKVQAAQAQYAAAVGTPDEAAAEVTYRRATVSPRRRLLQRFSAHPEGIRFLVDLRAELQPHLKGDRRLLALDVEMEYMFSTWFDVGFLDLQRISWDSPASLIEKLIRYEAVHDIRSWSDVKNRLDSDRRCYGFFHPRLPGEPLIFVEVALIDDMAASITPLLDETAAPANLAKATHAIFYSISNTQLGLKGVSFGDSLIKRVVDALKEEFPRLKTFATLSPIPGLRAWLTRNAEPELLKAWEPLPEPVDDTARAALLRHAARYLCKELKDGKPLDPVARFHLGNGARVERINWAGDPSAKGLKQSYGLMVNYLYDLKKLDRHRAQLALGKIPTAAAVGKPLTEA